MDPPREFQFALKARDIFRLIGVCGVQQLDGDCLAGLLVMRLPDDAHAATPNLLEQREALQGRAGPRL